MTEEIQLQRNYLANETVETIYFGGGTPSLLSPLELTDLFRAIQDNFSLGANPEITLEANPDDLTFAKLTMLKDVGVNRLSIGVQSFDDEILKFLNRAHSGEAASMCIEDSRKAGFENISIDMIYAIPNQDHSQWLKNIHEVIKINPEHISSYSLTIEEKTAFGRWANLGKLKAVTDEVAGEQLETLVKELKRAGYDQYEVSNFGKPLYYSIHNSNYWNQQHYLGIGPSAHSYNGASRQHNINNNHLYVKSIHNKKIPYEREELVREDFINEYLLTTLRTKWGCNLTKLKQDFGYDIYNEHEGYLEELHLLELAEISNNILILTDKGKLLADKIASDFFLLKT